MAVTAADMDVRFSTEGVPKVESDMRRVGSGFDQLSQKGQKAGSFLRGVFQYAAGDLLARGFQAAGRAASDAVGDVLDFGANMANVNSIMQISDAQLRALSADVLDLASDPRVAAGPAELAAGLYEIASSGFQGAEGLRVLEAAAIAATAGITTTDIAARGITAILNAYNLGADQAGRVSDVMFQTVQDGVITFEQLANNLGNTLAPAAQLGVSIEELGAAYAQMTLKGVSASMAETQIASLMKASMNPTAALTAAVNAHGFATAKAAIDAEGFAGFLQIVMAAAGGNEAALYDMLGTQEAVNAALILGSGNAAEYAAEVDKMGNATGATQKALEKQMASARYQLGQVRKELQILATEILIGFEPSVARGAKAVAGFVGDLIDVTKYVKDFVSGDTGSGIAQFGGGISNQAMLLQKVPGPLRGAAMAMASVTKASIDMGKGLFEAFRMGQGVDQLVQVLPKSLQGFGRAAFTLADDLGDIVRQIRQGDWQGLVKELKDTGRHVINMSIDVALKLGKLIVDYGGDFLEWVQDQLFGSGRVPKQAGRHRGGATDTANIEIDGGLLGLRFGVSGARWDDGRTDWAQLAADLLVAADDELSKALGIQATDESLDQSYRAGQDAGRRLANRVSDGVKDGLQEDSGEKGDGGHGIGWDDVKAFLEWSPFPETEPTIIDEWMAWAQGAGSGIHQAIVGGLRNAIFGHVTGVSGQGPNGGEVFRAGGVQGLSDELFAAIQGLADDITASFDGLDWGDIPHPDLPDWVTDYEWLTGPVDDLIDTVQDKIDDLKEIWDQLTFWNDTVNGGDRAEGERQLAQIGMQSRPQAGGGASNGGFVARPFLSGGGPDMGGALAAAGQAAIDAAADFDTGQAALDALAEGFGRAVPPIDLFAEQTDAAMARMENAIDRHAMGAATSLNTALASAMAQAATNAQQGAAGVDQALAWLPGALFGRGANASQAFASGLWSGVPAAQAAARALAAAADEAVAARLAIHSPSRVFAGHADNAANSFIDTLNRRQGDIAAAYSSAFGPPVSTPTATYRPAESNQRPIIVVQAVKSSEMVNLLRQAEQGGEFARTLGAEFDALMAGGLN